VKGDLISFQFSNANGAFYPLLAEIPHSAGKEDCDYRLTYEARYITASASASDDGKTLHLIVFNKSMDQDIKATIRVSGFEPAHAVWWEVNNANLLSPGAGCGDRGRSVRKTPLQSP
jgi:hypothetical protein